MPSDAQLMQIAIDDLNNSSLSLEDRHRALQELLILVEPIDNANGMHVFSHFNFNNCNLCFPVGIMYSQMSTMMFLLAFQF